jgi:hypothetical protein
MICKKCGHTKFLEYEYNTLPKDYSQYKKIIKNL